MVRRPRLAGAEMLVVSLSVQHALNGNVPLIVSTHPAEQGFSRSLDENSWRIETRFPLVELGVLGRLAHLTREVRDFHPDIVFAHTVLPSLFVRAALYGKSYPVVTVLHAARPDYSGKLAIIERIQPPPAGIVAVAAENREWYRATIRKSAEIELISNGIDFEGIRRAEANRSEVREAIFGAASQDLVILALGRITPVKRQDIALAAFEQISKLRPQSRLVFAGLTEDQKIADRIALAASESAGKIVNLGPWPRPFFLLAGADVLIIPSDHEAHPLVMLEGLASGIEVIGSHIPAHQFAANMAGVSLCQNLDDYISAVVAVKPDRFARDMRAYDIRQTARRYERFANHVLQTSVATNRSSG